MGANLWNGVTCEQGAPRVKGGGSGLWIRCSSDLKRVTLEHVWNGALRGAAHARRLGDMQFVCVLRFHKRGVVAAQCHWELGDMFVFYHNLWFPCLTPSCLWFITVRTTLCLNPKVNFGPPACKLC